MNWHLIQSGFSTGQFNMEFDYQLALNCKEDDAYFRLYRWKPFCISIGANQNFSDVNLIKAEEDGIDVVKRPTGGRAILHAEELTYSVIIPLSYSLTPKEIYYKTSIALIKGLSLYNPALSKAELEPSQPYFPSVVNSPTGLICFASTAKNEVKFHGRKLIGSAQRKMQNTVLQHGSILCGDFHKKLPDYLALNQQQKENLKKELSEKTIEIESIVNKRVDYERLSECIIIGFENEFKIDFIDTTIKSTI
ncbi:biotin/lipoate A/B protein ligase family protein [Melioribacteraceae bacterium 4301-Me]|uniref:lipoate--protein ligase family protein n=1 Tax=Pyranulibacter aquaticus TaxID=3163344 RepID=UPI003597790E